jgi:hypothetical protein
LSCKEEFKKKGEYKATILEIIEIRGKCSTIMKEKHNSNSVKEKEYLYIKRKSSI